MILLDRVVDLHYDMLLVDGNGMGSILICQSIF